MDDALDDEDLDNEHVRALAAALAPQMQQLHDLMDDPLLHNSEDSQEIIEEDLLRMDSDEPQSDNNNNNNNCGVETQQHKQEDVESSYEHDVDDDDMDQEMEQLAVVEDILRQELDLAQDFAAFFGSPSKMTMMRQEDDESYHLETSNISISNPVRHQEENTATTSGVETSATVTGCQQQSDNSKNATNKQSTTIQPQTPPRPNPVPPATKNDTSRKPTESTPAIPNSPHRPSSTAVPPLYRSPSYTYTRAEHFDHLQLQQEPNGAWYSVDLTQHVLGPSPYNTNTNNDSTTGSSQPSPSTQKPGIKEYCLTVLEWKRLFVGLRLKEEDHHLRNTNPARQLQSQFDQSAANTTPIRNNSMVRSPLSAAKRAGLLSPAPKPEPHTKPPPVRTISIRIRPDVLCGAVMDAVSQTFVHFQPHSAIKKRQGGHLQGTIQGAFRQETNISSQFRSPTKTPTTSSHRRTPSIGKNKHGDNNNITCTYFVDVQLCTQRSPNCERVLLLRIYHWTKEQQENDTNDEENLWLTPPPSPEVLAVQAMVPAEGVDTSSNIGGVMDEMTNSDSLNPPSESTPFEEEVNQSANLHLREACALVQRINSPELARKIRPLSFYSSSSSKPPSSPHIVENTVSVRAAVSESLLQNYRACPSVLTPGTTMTLPALSPQDWPVIQASWKWIQAVWDELETRELTFTSLLEEETAFEIPADQNGAAEFLPPSPPGPRFGAFPALPTLDVQYCSQLRRLSRDAMTVNLLKAASVLEEYARQAEYNCANLIDILKQTFARYGVTPPPLPQPAPLSAYLLDFVPPQNVCPPWGTKVMEALNQVAAMTHDAGQSSQRSLDMVVTLSGEVQQLSPDADLGSEDLAENAVQMVYQAFQKQDDEEQSARLARKNLQVMDRLAKMQAHQRASVQALSRAQTATAKAAADDFWAKAQKSKSESQDVVGPWREVPLVRWSLGVGGSSGTCLVTAHQIMVTQPKIIPLLGYNKSTWFLLRDVEFAVVPSEGTLLSPLSTVQVLQRGTGVELCSFRPSHAAMRLKAFLDIVRKEAEDAEFAGVSDTLRAGIAGVDAEKAILLEAESDSHAGL